MPDIWLDVDTALSEVPVNIMPLLDDGDFKTRETGVAFDAGGMDLVWNFVTTAGAMTQTAVTPTSSGDYDWAHQGDGMYSIEIPASGGASINNDTEGFGWFTGVATGVLPWRGPVIGFRASGLNDALIDSAYSTTRGLAGTALPAAAAEAAGGLYTRGSGAGQIAQTNNGRIDTDVKSIANDVITASAIQNDAITAAKIATGAIDADAIADNAIDAGAIATGAITNAKFAAGAIDAAAIAANAIGASELAADAVTEIQSGLATAAALATAQTDLDTITGADGVILATTQANYAPAKAGDQMALVNDAITAGKFDESTAFPLGAADGSTLTAINLPDQTMNITGNITGNLSGSVGSVTGNVGGNVGGTINGLTAAALKDFFDTDSTTTYGSAVAGSVVKEIADNAGGSSLTAEAIADEVETRTIAAVTTVNGLAANTVTAAALAADAVTEIQSGLATGADLATVDSNVDAIKAKTDSLTFTVAGQVDSNIQYVNDVQVTGDGQTGTEWGPA